MLSMKQAASRPRPPLPSAGSGSIARRRSRLTPNSASASRIGSVRPELFSEFEQQPARQELERQVVHALALLRGIVARASQPAIDDPIPQRQRRRHEPVAIAGNQRVPPGRIGQLLDDQAPQRIHLSLARGGGGRRAGSGEEGVRLIHGMFTVSVGASNGRLVNRRR